MENETDTATSSVAQPDAQQRSNIRTLYRVGKRDGVDVRSPVLIDFDEIKVRRGGLLEQAIDAQPALEVAKGDLDRVKQVLNVCKEHQSIRSILSAPIATIDTTDIHNLFRDIDDAIDHALIQTQRHANGFGASSAFRRFLGRIKSPLSDGFTLKTMRAFKSKFRWDDNDPRPIISDRVDPGEADLRYAGPITAIPLKRGEKPEDAALDHMEHRNDRIIRACWVEIDYALKWRDRISKLKDAPLPEGLLNGYASAADLMAHFQSQYYKSLLPYDLLRLFTRYTKDAELHLYNNLAELLNETKGGSNTVFGGIATVLRHYPKSARIAYPLNPYPLLLIDSYLPNRAILCIRHLFQMRFAFNVDTANNLTRSCIHKVDDGYEIRPLKGKTDQLQSKHVGKEEPDMIRLIELLLKNEENIDQFWRRNSDSVFTGWLGTVEMPMMGRFQTSRRHAQFLRNHKLPHFSFDELRNQSSNTDYMKYRDPYRTKAIMGHGSLAHTSHYLNQKINQLLSAQNMQHFMHTLASSIVWAVAGEEALAKCGFDKKDVDRKLLFPVSDVSAKNEAAKAQVDEWLQNQAGKIPLTRSRIALTIRQWRYYRTQWQRLYNDNPERFEKVHLPRMIFAKALCEVIMESEYAELFNELKQKFDPEPKED